MTPRGIAIASSTGVALAATVVSLLLLLPVGNAATTALPAGNLVKNPGGEVPLGSANSNNEVRVAQWTTMPNPVPNRPAGEDPATQAVRYSNTQWYPTPALSKAIGGGRNFFAGWYTKEESGAFQLIDVSRAATDIDAGGVKACLSAYLGGGASASANAAARAHLQFLGEDEAERARLTIGPVTRGHRRDATTLLWRASERAVPSGTRTLKVWLNFTGFFSNYAYADNVVVALTKGRCIPQLAVRCQQGALLATVTPSDGVRTQRVRFQVRGAKGQKLATDARAPFTARVPMTGLTGRLTVTATATQAGSGNVILTKKSRRC